LSIGVYGSIHSEAEDIFHGLERRSNFEFSKERAPLLQSSLETKTGNLLSGRVNLTVVISVDLLSKDLLGRFDVGDIFTDTGSNQTILKPTIRSFDLTFGLGRKGIADLDIAILQDLFPLRGGFVGEEMVFSPEGVPSLNKSEDRMRVHIIGIRESISKDDGLEGLDVGPAGLFLDQGCVEDQTTMIIQGSDKIPFLLSGWCPKMKRGVMLNQFSDITG
jgi:hypothetical protein